MKIIAMISTKGGSGKSTLAASLSVEATTDGRVYLADLDPQASSLSWWRRRDKPDNPLIIAGAPNATHAIRAIEKKGELRDYLFLDTPGSFLDVIEDAIVKADVVLLVTQPTPRDLEAQGPALELIRKHGKADQTIIVLNRCDARSAFPGAAVKKLKGFTHNAIITIAGRAAYPRADAAGDVVQELSKDAESEIITLWKAIKAISKRSAGRRDVRRSR